MVYIFLFIVLLLLLILYLVFIRKLRIKWRTLFTRGFSPNRGKFGLYTYTGNQGKGKTYSLVEYIFDNKDKCFFFGNIKSLKCVKYLDLDENKFNLLINELDTRKSLTMSNSYLKLVNNANFVYYNGFDGLIKMKKLLDSSFFDKLIGNKQIVFVFDEIFTELTKKSQLSTEVQDFLCQLRKRKIIFLTTAQVWSEVPLYFRRLCRFQINCNMFPFFTTGFLIKEFNDAENMKWDDELQEHIAPTIELSFSKVRRKVSNCYDTTERITNDKK